MTAKKYRYTIPLTVEVEVWDSDPEPKKTARRLAREFMQPFLPMEVGGGGGFAVCKKAGVPREETRA